MLHVETESCSQRVRRRVLIIDANDLVLRAITRVLALADCSVRSLQDPTTALAVAAEFRPNVLIVDVGTRRYDAAALLCALRDCPELHGCDFIGTASSWRDDMAPLGLRRVLNKPFDVAQLYEAMLTGSAACARQIVSESGPDAR